MQRPCYFQQNSSGPQPVAVIVNYDNIAKTADSTGTTGDELYLLILRNNLIIEITPTEANNGNNHVNFSATLENGDKLCIRSSFDGFVTHAMDCKEIPTPDFGFVPIN